MRIVGLFTEVFTVGGIQRINRHVCLALSQFAQREGHPVSFLSLMDDSDAVDGRYLEGEPRFRGFRRNKAAFVATALEELRHRPDVVYVAHINLAPVGLTMRLLRPSLRYGVALYGIEAWKLLSPLRRFALQQAAFITSISRYTSEQAIKSQGLKPERIHLVPPGLDPFWISACEGELPDRDDLDLPTGKLMLSVSRLAASDKGKGVDCVIRAMPKILQRVSDAYYVVVGRGADLDRLKSLAMQQQVQDRVLFVGKKNERALRGYYSNCDLFVMPSKKEGFGIVFLEAMLFKKSVIGGRHGGTPEIIKEGETGFLVEHEAIEELVEKTVLLLTDETLRRRMGEAGYMHLMGNYTFEHFSQRLSSTLFDRA